MSGGVTDYVMAEEADDAHFRAGCDIASGMDRSIGRAHGGNILEAHNGKPISAPAISICPDKTSQLLAQFGVAGETPEARIGSFIQFFIAGQVRLVRYGWPVESLHRGTAKRGYFARDRANESFAVFRAWLREQFTLLGCDADADRLAMQLLARGQGVATLAIAFDDDTFVRHEVARMSDWLRSKVSAAANVAL